MSWIPPKDVGPAELWCFKGELHSGEAGEVAIAEGTWCGEPAIGIRWNGTDEKPAGTPVS